MKWFKHFTDSLDDPFIQELLEKFGAKGYLAYFGLLEIVAKENGNKLTGTLEINPSYLRRKLRISITVLTKIYHFCNTNAKLSVNFCEKLWQFSIPKMSELKDNYTKDLQASCKKLSIEVEEEAEKDIYNGADAPEKTPSKVKRDGKFIPPTLEEIRLYCTERDNGIDPERFMAHYESNGWMVGKNKMKSWKAAVVTWEKNNPKQKQLDAWDIPL